VKTIILIGIGSGLGGILRYWLSGVVAERIGETFPWGTMSVNIIGSLLIGLLAAFVDSERVLMSPGGRQFLMMGVCGGFTTFSSFSLQTFRLMQDNEWLHAGGNILLSVVLCLLSVFAGYKLGQLVN
jgi:CrcB protein